MYNRITTKSRVSTSATTSAYQRCATPIEALMDFFINLSPKGRSSRADFWWVILFVNFPHGILTSYLWCHPSRVLGISLAVFSFFLIWADYCLFTRRAHDSGRGCVRSLLWLACQVLLLAAFVMINVVTYRILISLILVLLCLNFIMMLLIAVIGFFKSSPCANEFGPVPHSDTFVKNEYSRCSKEMFSGTSKDSLQGGSSSITKMIGVCVCCICCAIIAIFVLKGMQVGSLSDNVRDGVAKEKKIKQTSGVYALAEYELGQILDFGDDFVSYADDFKKVGVKFNTYFKVIDVEEEEVFNGMKGFSRIRIGVKRFYANGIAKCKITSINLETKDLPKSKRLQTVNKYARILEKSLGVRFKYERREISLNDEGDEYIFAMAKIDENVNIHISAYAPLAKFVCVGVVYSNGRNGDKTDERDAVSRYRKTANQCDVDAQYNLGLCYENGRGVEQDVILAARWYRKAADLGDARAQYKMGFCYETGRGVERDKMAATRWYRISADNGYAEAQYTLGLGCEYGGEEDKKEAVCWFRKAADLGHAGALDRLGDCYNYGWNGLGKEVREAQRWYRKAVDVYRKNAEKGDADAQSELGRHYELGLGVEKNYQEAQRWYRKAVDVYGNAAIRGDADAQYHLGTCYEYGRGVAVDKEEAKFWLLKAAEQGSSSAKFILQYGDL